MASIVIGGGNTNVGLRFLDEKDRAFRRDAARDQAAREQARLALAQTQFGESVNQSKREFDLRQQEMQARQAAQAADSDRASRSEQLAREKFEEAKRHTSVLESGTAADRQHALEREKIGDQRYESDQERKDRQEKENLRRFGVTQEGLKESRDISKEHLKLSRGQFEYAKDKDEKQEQYKRGRDEKADKRKELTDKLTSIGRDRASIEKRLSENKQRQRDAKDNRAELESALKEEDTLKKLLNRAMHEESSLTSRDPLELPQEDQKNRAAKLTVADERQKHAELARKANTLAYLKEYESPNLATINSLDKAHAKVQELAQKHNLDPKDLRGLATKANPSLKESDRVISFARNHPDKEEGVASLFEYLKKVGELDHEGEKVNIWDGRPAKPGEEVIGRDKKKHVVREGDMMTVAEYNGLLGVDTKGVVNEVKESLEDFLDDGGLSVETQFRIQKIIDGEKIKIPDKRSEKELKKHVTKLFNKLSNERRTDRAAELFGKKAAPFATTFRNISGAALPYAAASATGTLAPLLTLPVFSEVKKWANRGDVDTAEMLVKSLLDEGYSRKRAADLAAKELKRRQ